MQLQRLTTIVSSAPVQPKQPLDITRALHPEGLPTDVVDAVVPQDLAVRLNPGGMKVSSSVPAEVDVAAALNPCNQQAPAPAPPQNIDFAGLLNPPELQPPPGPAVRQEPVNIRQVLDSPFGRVAENQTGSLTYFD